MQQDVRFSRITWATNQHPENISGQAWVALLVPICDRKVGIIILNFHPPYVLHRNHHVGEKVATKPAKDKAEVEEQEQQIWQKFKTKKIDREFGQLSGEELFKPITKRLDKAVKEPEPEVEEPVPNYEMNEFDRKVVMMKIFRPHFRRKMPPYERHERTEGTEISPRFP